MLICLPEFFLSGLAFVSEALSLQEGTLTGLATTMLQERKNMKSASTSQLSFLLHIF